LASRCRDSGVRRSVIAPVEADTCGEASIAAQLVESTPAASKEPTQSAKGSL
jgi:hypothetical protein